MFSRLGIKRWQRTHSFFVDLTSKRCRGDVWPVKKNHARDVRGVSACARLDAIPCGARLVPSMAARKANTACGRAASGCYNFSTETNNSFNKVNQESISELRHASSKDAHALFALLDHELGSVLTVYPPDNNNSDVVEEDDLQRYNQSWDKQYQGRSAIVCRPSSTTQVQAIVSYCYKHCIGIVPQGGNTGLVGGSVPLPPVNTTSNVNLACEDPEVLFSKEIILSLERMNKIYNLDPISGILTCDAGCTLQSLMDYVSTKGFQMPVDLGSRGSCHIGGNVSTNAGGHHFARYGSMHANVLGLEVVCPPPPSSAFLHSTDSSEASSTSDASMHNKAIVLDCMSTNRKDSTGFSLTHLFIGAEGTLGVVTKVSIQCPPLAHAQNVALLACPTYTDVLQTMHLAKKHLGEVLSAVEFMDGPILRLMQQEESKMDVVKRSVTSMIPPLDPTRDMDANTNNEVPPFCLLVESQGANARHDAEKMQTLLESCLEDGCVKNGSLAQDFTQIHEMWHVREACNPMAAQCGYVYKYDLSLPIDAYHDFVIEVERHLQTTLPRKPYSQSRSDSDPQEDDKKNDTVYAEDILVTSWGHVMDGNLHLNVITPQRFQASEPLRKVLEPFVMSCVLERGGSISAEHGVGVCKKDYLLRAKGEQVVGRMWGVKKEVFDDKGIMNPGKVLPRLGSI